MSTLTYFAEAIIATLVAVGVGVAGLFVLHIIVEVFKPLWKK